MAESIEDFVAKLQTEGVEAGKQEGDKLIADAKDQAEKIAADANAQAERIIADARGEADNILARGKTELALAARDTMLKLRDALSRSLQAVLRHKVAATLNDVDFLGKALHELILLYAKDELSSGQGLTINVSPEMRKNLAAWAVREIGQKKLDNVDVPIDLKGMLSGAGFEYTASGATVEVTAESVVEMLGELIGPELRAILESATGEVEEK